MEVYTRTRSTFWRSVGVSCDSDVQYPNYTMLLKALRNSISIYYLLHGKQWLLSSSMKAHLKKVVGTVKLNFEELTTILAQIEACLNSRSLAPMTTADGEEVEALTPGHFLIGKPLCALPHPAIPDKNPSLLKRWRLCQYIIQHFWKQWPIEYLNTLQKFYKWHYPKRNLKPGDVVILCEDGAPVNSWPLGKIQEVFSRSRWTSESSNSEDSQRSL